jgi:hypothetical protein
MTEGREPFSCGLKALYNLAQRIALGTIMYIQKTAERFHYRIDSHLIIL